LVGIPLQPLPIRLLVERFAVRSTRERLLFGGGETERGDAGVSGSELLVWWCSVEVDRVWCLCDVDARAAAGVQCSAGVCAARELREAGSARFGRV
jgi:hypothetical protein